MSRKTKNAIPPPGADKKTPKNPHEKKPDEKADRKEARSGPTEPLPIDVAGYALSPDGKWLAVWAHDPETPGEKKQKDAKADAAWVNHERACHPPLSGSAQARRGLDGALKPVAVAPDVQMRGLGAQLRDRLLVITEPPNDVSDLGPS